MKKKKDPFLSPYIDPSKHAAVADIIRSLSTNKDDIRKVAISGLDMSAVRDVLDLGCGYGFMSEMIASVAEKGTRIIGIDALEENRSVFMSLVSKLGCVPEFLRMELSNRLPWETNSFDLIVCTYSLYFFVDIIGEIARVLRPGGIFIPITHSDKSFIGLYETVGLRKEESLLSALIEKFSAENGMEKLLPFFSKVDKVDYINSLCFDPSQINNLKDYIKFKLPFLKSGYDILNGLPLDMEQEIENAVCKKENIIIEKHDAIFCCKEPICR
jgi:SAM-dependent methyltransferase